MVERDQEGSSLERRDVLKWINPPGRQLVTEVAGVVAAGRQFALLVVVGQCRYCWDCLIQMVVAGQDRELASVDILPGTNV